MHKKSTGIWFILPHFTGVLIFLGLPFVDVVRRSFCRVSGGFCGLENYRNVLENAPFRLAAWNTLRFTVVCIPLLLVLSLLLAVLLSHTPSPKWLPTAYLVPMAVPAACVAFFWKLLFDAHGMVNGALAACGRSGADWMNTPYAFGILVGSYIWKNSGILVLLWLTALEQVPQEIYEAARMDGAGGVRIFFSITLPSIRPAADAIAVIALFSSFQVFREAYLAAGSYPHESIYLLQHLFGHWFSKLAVDKMAAGAVLFALTAGAAVQIFVSWKKCR